ncbi:nuclease-related domain-containing DEAD/DEAH box helicase [Nocardioides terrisoli]|uniref:nuclease-related domain-containing DEAD/DEAH box helicase n=1 Tax=Nocardioides terrisoli TaxID=3388267 RepID=UPI00287BB767|nr:ATP-binding domain-containing protein [Nocardioides marmorisolisilvae]
MTIDLCSADQMTPNCRPEQPQFASEAEREVWQRLRDTLPADAILIANQWVIDEHKDHEADLVVLLPDVGAVVLEVKGGSVWYDGEHWHQSGGGERRIHPVEQAKDAKYALRDYVESDPRWSRGRITWAHGVVTPYSDFSSDFGTPDCPRWALHDRVDMADLADRVANNARGMARGTKAPSYDDLVLLSQVLHGRSFTERDLNAEAAQRRSASDRLTAEQAQLLRVTRLLNRVEVRGGAGSGKTVLALAQAKELSRGRDGEPPQRVALLCYSIGLGEFLKREVEGWPKRARPAFVGTYEELGRSWGAPGGEREDSEFWEERLPSMMAELARELPPDKRFDAFVVDEAQDFAESWWTPLLRAMQNEEESGLYIYSDENQRIFARFGRPPVPLVPLVLDHNLRNTKQIHAAFGPLAPTQMTPRGGEGVEVSFLPADDPLDAADDAVELLLEVGWHPANIALLTTGSRHTEQLNLTEELGQHGYWRTFWEDDVFYGHVLGCKGLERPAVVLCVNETTARDRSREKLYVGMSRATDQLIVVGQPDVVREIAGPHVAARLGI